MNEYDARVIAPPKGREILVQIISKYGHSDLEWYPARFDETITGQADLAVFDDLDNYVGDVWFWKDYENRGEVK
jgi:hypothetical protein